MSRSAVRESLIRLDTLRIVESRPKSGVYLQPYGAERSIEAMVLFAETNTPLSAAEVAQSVELRSVLENEAMRLACLRRTQSDLKDLQQILRDSAAAIARGETLADLDARVPQGHRRGHQERCAAALHQRLLPACRASGARSTSTHRSRANARTPSTCSSTGAIEAQDAVSGQQILRRHLKGVDAYFRMFFSEGPDAPAPARACAGRREARHARSRPGAAPDLERAAHPAHPVHSSAGAGAVGGAGRDHRRAEHRARHAARRSPSAARW